MSFGLLQVFVELGNLHGTSNYVLYRITGVAFSYSVSHNRVQVINIPVLLLACSSDWTCRWLSPTPTAISLCVLLDSFEWIFRTYKLNVLTWLGLLLLCMIFYQCSYSDFFYLTFLIIGSHIVFVSILGLLSRSLWPNICADSLRRLILQCSVLSIIWTSSHKGRWLPFSFHIVLDHVEFRSWLDPEEISLESWTTCEYCPDIIWTTYPLDPFG